jgi:alkanesulfonate monooxygenase SsuD/methylene tetrahydromethanopterin reductase-like flavin-dependent oxidoreductase (luciferase family)
MAQVTEHLGFGVTSTLTYEPPLPFARRMSTLEHLTGGRIGWNIVTGYLASAAKGAGKEKPIAHDTRYDIAEEYMDVIYKLWESSWDDDAVLRDRASGVYADPSKVQRITHDGEYFKLEAIRLAEPLPQRTPVLYQAGSSPRTATSPRAMPNACSCRGRRRKFSRRASPTSAALPPRMAAHPATSRSSR